MTPCISCSKTGSYIFRALEVQTLHVRDLGGEKRVQALGEIQSFSVCETCAKERLLLDLNAAKAVRQKVVPFGMVLAAGVVLGVCDYLFAGLNRVFLTLSLAAVVCGCLGIFEALKKARERQASLAGMEETEALWEAAWAVITDHAPRKYQDSDLTYIPVTKKTLAMKNGDLMILYDLLPAIAIEAHKRIHQGK